MHKGSSTSTSE